MDNSNTQGTHHTVENALRDIVYMYKVFVDYGGIYDDLGSAGGTFDPFHFLDFPSSQVVSEEDILLLRTGSALKLLSVVLEAWSQREYPKRHDAVVERVKKSLEEGRLRGLPDIEAALRTAIETDDYRQIGGKTLYVKYVLGFFQRLTEPDEFMKDS